ncbi:hypothetical protein [Catenulispora rubra]|uniref:hypothetical protein n=1 Tax=Catenulispora rubra TaxID=280293 RepID=UPI0018921D67|nr:hypothetical protein [Catenulispora rubra]
MTALDAVVVAEHDVAVRTLFSQGRRMGFTVAERLLRREFDRPEPVPPQAEPSVLRRYARWVAGVGTAEKLTVYGFVIGALPAAAIAGQDSSAVAAQEIATVAATAGLAAATAWWLRGRVKNVGLWVVSVATFALCVVALADIIAVRHQARSLPVTRIVLVGFAGAMLALLSRSVLSRMLVGVAVLRERATVAAARREVVAWQRQRARFQAAEDARLIADQVLRWEPARMPSRCDRIDVYGGTPQGWQALATVLTASLLGSGLRVTVLNLASPAVLEELVATTRSYGAEVDVQALPADGGYSDLLAGSDRHGVITAIVQAVHGGEADVARTAAMADEDFLARVCQVLEGPDGHGEITMPRLALGLRAVMGEPLRPGELADDNQWPNPGQLTRTERESLVSDTFGDDSRREGLPRLRQLLAAAEALGALRLGVERRAVVPLQVVQSSAGRRGARSEFVREFLVAALTRKLETGYLLPQALVVIGADGVATRHIEDLTTTCALQGVPLVLMFEHLRGNARQIVGGGGLVGFMRLGNHEEATVAADFVGREYKMVFSSATWTHGEETSTSASDSTGGSESTGTSESAGRSVTGDRVGSTGIQKPGAFFTKRVNSRDETRTTTSGSERNWSRGTSRSEGVSDSRAETLQRVHEHAVAPETLQQLPDFAMLLVDRADGQLKVRAVEVDPRIAAFLDSGMALNAFGENQDLGGQDVAAEFPGASDEFELVPLIPPIIDDGRSAIRALPAAAATISAWTRRAENGVASTLRRVPLPWRKGHTP